MWTQKNVNQIYFYILRHIAWTEHVEVTPSEWERERDDDEWEGRDKVAVSKYFVRKLMETRTCLNHVVHTHVRFFFKDIVWFKRYVGRPVNPSWSDWGKLSLDLLLRAFATFFFIAKLTAEREKMELHGAWETQKLYIYEINYVDGRKVVMIEFVELISLYWACAVCV